jgi:hypothetical protein
LLWVAEKTMMQFRYVRRWYGGEEWRKVFGGSPYTHVMQLRTGSETRGDPHEIIAIFWNVHTCERERGCCCCCCCV